MLLRESAKYRYTVSDSPKLYYRCVDCGASHAAHPDGRPVGTPADKVTRKARREAHVAFEAWREHYGMTKSEAYLTLAIRMGVRETRAHIGQMNHEECLRVIEVCECKAARN